MFLRYLAAIRGSISNPVTRLMVFQEGMFLRYLAAIRGSISNPVTHLMVFQEDDSFLQLRFEIYIPDVKPY